MGKMVIMFGEGHREVSITIEDMKNVNPPKLRILSALAMRAFKEELAKIHNAQRLAKLEEEKKSEAELEAEREKREAELKKEQDKQQADQEKRLIAELAAKHNVTDIKSLQKAVAANAPNPESEPNPQGDLESGSATG